ncbi:Peptidase_T [Hexamita inflata]|uniref:Peptidase T n=1 Tax=Hexamita inflata TaxID=28002 RepID=A0AA86US13_9EUKA|nr:Peptidase T [Hexamita inflata]
MNSWEQRFTEKFIRYAKISTASDPQTSNKCPSTQCQFDLAKLLEQELKQLGLRTELTDKCILYSYYNEQNTKSRIVLSAHVDVSPDAPSVNVNPQIVQFQGKDVVLQHNTIPLDNMPNINIGDYLITTDGSTLLGGDDKAGIAAIMLVLEELINNKITDIPSICVCFTPDEEIGLKGAQNVDVQKLIGPAESYFGLTLDGMRTRQLNFDTFNAVSFNLQLDGFNTHPGYAYNTMINSILSISNFVNTVSQKLIKPEDSQLEQGYVLFNKINAEVLHSSTSGILRSFSAAEMAHFKSFMEETAKSVFKTKYSLQFSDTYQNLNPYLDITIQERLTKIGEKYNANVVKFRGGTDGSFLSSKGVATPNVWSGTGNFHSVLEFVVVKEAVEAAMFVLDVIKSE